jgi:hypothetical protein
VSVACVLPDPSPYAVDGLAHLGGFAMGLMLGIVLVPSTPETKRYRMIVWGCRIVALPLAIVAFALTAKNFCESSTTNVTTSVANLVRQRGPRKPTDPTIGRRDRC